MPRRGKTWLCRFRAICHDSASLRRAIYSKQRPCRSCFFCFSRQILQMFTGNCESQSSEKGPRALRFPVELGFTRVRLYLTFPASRFNSKERPNEDPTEDAGDAGACLGTVCRTGTDNSVRYDEYREYDAP